MLTPGRLLIVGFISLMFVGCAQEKRDEPRQRVEPPPPQTRPAPTTEPRRTTPPTTNRDTPSTAGGAAPEAASRPIADPKRADVSASETQPAEVEEPPDYIVVLERFTADRPYRLDARIEQDTRLVIRTDNIKRLQIRRAHSGLSPSRSVAILIDQQGIEWVARLDAVELERSVNGAWRPAERK